MFEAKAVVWQSGVQLVSHSADTYQPGVIHMIMTLRGLLVVVKIAILHPQTRVLQVFRDLFTGAVWSVVPTSEFWHNY